MTCKRRSGGCTRLDYKNNSDIMKELNAQPITEFIEHCTCNWKNHDLPMPAQESHYSFSITNEKDEDLSVHSSSDGMRQ
jgi:hypothetical protein